MRGKGRPSATTQRAPGATAAPHGPRPPATLTSEQQWLADLATLLREAKRYFADVAWQAEDGALVYAHKGVVFARASGSFQQKYLAPANGSSNSHGDSTLSLPYNGGHRSVTPNSGARDRDASNASHSLRSHSPTSMLTVVSASPSNPMPLGATDVSIFRSLLEHFYCSTSTAESFAILFEGFEEGVREGEPELTGVEKLRADLLYSWRSKLYADVSLTLGENASSTFTTHRAILAARSPYFRSLLLGNYSDSAKSIFTLPSPPFTASSTTFILGFLYTGTLDFGNRQFDLTTAFEIWRGAAYLQISQLQVEVETKIESMINVARAARIYTFALAPDVNSQRLARVARPFVVDQFGDTWNCPPIGHLDYEAQRKLVGAVCEGITPLTVTKVGKASFGLRKKLELEKANWAVHVRAMLDGIDERLKAQLGKSLPEVVVSPAFVGLVDGQGFSTDVLEWLVSDLVVASLTEAKAPETYQALVGSVLLREEGILMDAKVIIEDAKNGIVKYIKRRWMGIVSVQGFDKLQSWCIKELSDELEISVEDLLTPIPKASSSRLTTPRAKPRSSTVTTATGMAASRRSGATTPTSSSTAPLSASTSSRRAATPPSSSTTTLPSSSTTPRSGPASLPSAALSSVPSRRAGAATSTSSTPGTTTARAPRISTGSVVGSNAGPRPSSRSAAPASQAPAIRGTPIAVRQARVSTGTRAVPPVRLIAKSDASSKPVPSRTTRPELPNGTTTTVSSSPSTTTSAGPSSSATPPSKMSRNSPVPPQASTSAAATEVGHHRSAPPNGRVEASRALTKRPSSLAHPTGAPGMPTVPKSPRSPATSTARSPTPLNGNSVPPSPSAVAKGKAPATNARAPAATRVRKQSSSSATSSKTTEATIPGDAAPLRRPASSTSVRSVSSVRAPSTTTAIRRPPSASSLKVVTPKASVRSLNGTSNTTPKASMRIKEPPLPTSSASTDLPGTTLLSGIPCIVTVAADRPSRFRAAVRYIGGMVDEEGQWIGIEVAESAIPDEARDLPWHDGEVKGRRYFEMKSPASEDTAKTSSQNGSSSGRATPALSEPHDGRSAASSSTSSLRPPSRRGRRSSSSDAFESGPKKGLFVRPNQIVYVL